MPKKGKQMEAVGINIGYLLIQLGVLCIPTLLIIWAIIAYSKRRKDKKNQ